MWPLFSADCTTIKLCTLPLSFSGPELHQTLTNNWFCVSCAHGSATQSQTLHPSSSVGTRPWKVQREGEEEEGKQKMEKGRSGGGGRADRGGRAPCTAPAQLFCVPAPACDTELFQPGGTARVGKRTSTIKWKPITVYRTGTGKNQFFIFLYKYSIDKYKYLQ